MTLAPDVQSIAIKWGLDPAWLQAVVTAEGDGTAFVRAVQCSVPTVQNRAQALEVLCRTFVHRYRVFLHERRLEGEFLVYFGSQWAPLDAENDPHGLNKNWVPNVRKLLGIA